MSLPSRGDVLTLDYTGLDGPFCQVAALSADDLNTLDYAYKDGPLTGNAAQVITYDGSGVVILGSSATCILRYPFTGSGVARLGSEATCTTTPLVIGSGKVVIGDSAEVITSFYTFDASGFMVLGGVADVASSIHLDTSGVVLTGGDATCFVPANYQAGGGIFLNGSATFTPNGSGGIALSGSSDAAIMLSPYSASGECVLGDSATCLLHFNYTGSGCLFLLLPPFVITYDASGGLQTSNSAQSTLHFDFSAGEPPFPDIGPAVYGLGADPTVMWSSDGSWALSTQNFTASTSKLAYVMQIPDKIIIQFVGINIVGHTGTTPVLNRIGIQGLDADGKPDGVYIASSDFSVPVDGIWDNTFQWIPIYPSLVLDRPDHVCVVLECLGTPTGSNFSTFTVGIASFSQRWIRGYTITQTTPGIWNKHSEIVFIGGLKGYNPDTTSIQIFGHPIKSIYSTKMTSGNGILSQTLKFDFWTFSKGVKLRGFRMIAQADAGGSFYAGILPGAVLDRESVATRSITGQKVEFNTDQIGTNQGFSWFEVMLANPVIITAVPFNLLTIGMEKIDVDCGIVGFETPTDAEMVAFNGADRTSIGGSFPVWHLQITSSSFGVQEIRNVRPFIEIMMEEVL